jgi:transposase
MYLRTTRVRKGDKTYCYAQLVESVRRESDGVVVKKVLANLGPLDDQSIENFRLALKASKTGERLALGSVPRVPPSKPEANLRYLDLAVLLELWRQIGVDEVLSELMPRGGATVAPADVVASLVLHRCVDPGSKLHATRWFPRTALPELLDLPTTALENTRLHKVLEQLDKITPALMRALPRLYREPGAAFAALFMDVTDAWFYGQGPEMAQRGRGKDDVIRRMIGILLLSNEHGYPLRWSVLAGNAAETGAMLEQFRELRHVTWAKDAPIVIDRALGRTAYLRQLLDTGLPFLTALVRPEVPSYVSNLPVDAIARLRLQGEPSAQLRELGRCAEAEGFTKVDETLYLRDEGVVERPIEESLSSLQPDDPNDRCRFALRQALAIRTAVETHAAASRNAAGKALGLSTGLVKKYGALAELSEPLQAAILAGRARGVSLARLIALSSRPADEQGAAFEALVAEAAQRPARPAPAPTRAAPSAPESASLRVRAVSYFNPKLFLDQRARAQEKLERVQAALDKLNQELASPGSRRNASKALAAADRILRQKNLLDAFDVSLTEEELEGRKVLKLVLTLRKHEWARRRAFDGFCVLVTRPDCELAPESLCRVYRSKDTVETDFRVIKSCLKLRPVWHYTDAKVKAHVTLCMLALLLERTLRRRLGDAMTSELALEHLADGRLNHYSDSRGESAYLITRPEPTQAQILKALGLEHLADDMQMGDLIRPRLLRTAALA